MASGGLDVGVRAGGAGEGGERKARKGDVPEEPYRIPLGEANVSREGEDITIVAAGFVHRYALEAAEALSADGIEAEVVDLRTLSPMDHESVARSVEKTGKLVVVEEDVKTAGWGAEVVARIVEGESFYALDRAPARVAGASIVIVNGEAAAWIGRGGRQVLVWLPQDEPQRGTTAAAVAAQLASLGLLIAEINGAPAGSHPIAPYLERAGFFPSPHGYQLRHA